MEHYNDGMKDEIEMDDPQDVADLVYREYGFRYGGILYLSDSKSALKAKRKKLGEEFGNDEKEMRKTADIQEVDKDFLPHLVADYDFQTLDLETLSDVFEVTQTLDYLDLKTEIRCDKASMNATLESDEVEYHLEYGSDFPVEVMFENPFEIVINIPHT